ncbi:hypothetical protein [Streptomyces sp. NPDC048663]|uniref:hypothetical protein n=1 Tax=Streptomyces sp. NPDC048663 TaxID=3155638 RepID=UPI003428C5F7
MDEVRVKVHRPCTSGGRRVTVRRDGCDVFVGLAHSDHDLVVFLERMGLADPDLALDDPQVVDWEGAAPHQWLP